MISSVQISLFLLLSLFLSCFYYLQNKTPIQKQNSNQNLNNQFSVKYESISSIIRSNFSSIEIFENYIYAADTTATLSIWQYHQSQKKLNLVSIDRNTSQSLAQQNPAKDLVVTDQGILILAEDGKIYAHMLVQNVKIKQKIQIQAPQLYSQIVLINNNQLEDIYFAAITHKRTKIWFTDPTPLRQIVCNQSYNGFKYYGLSHDPYNNLIAVGDSTKAMFFKISHSASQNANNLHYLFQAYLPKTSNTGFQSSFMNNGTLIAINSLWVNSIIVDWSVPRAKVLSSIRTQSFIKTGYTTNLALNRERGNQQTGVIVNSRNKLQFYNVQQNKLQYIKSSSLIGSPQYYILKNIQTILVVQNQNVSVYDANFDNRENQIRLLDTSDIKSQNHYKQVTQLLYYEDYLITTSLGGVNNIKIWNFNSSISKLRLHDQYSLIDSKTNQNIRLQCLIMLNNPKQSNFGDNLHLALSGQNVFKILILILDKNYKIKSIIKSQSGHLNSITSIFITPDKKYLITSSLDTMIKVWDINTNLTQISQIPITTLTKLGPINHGVHDKSGTYYIYSHTSTFKNQLVNISLWKRQNHKGLTKIAQNVLIQSCYSNLTNLILSSDQQYLISLTQDGQMRLWRHVQWTMIDLLASLSLGNKNHQIIATKNNKLLVESQNQFIEYIFDFYGFIQTGRVSKSNQSSVRFGLLTDKNYFSGSKDGSIRVYSFSE